ncbi:MAG: hypothetical protein ACLGSH_03315 [Acidobacteriota bacterium]
MPRLFLFAAVAANLLALPAGAQIKVRAVPEQQPKIEVRKVPSGPSAFAPGSPLDALPVASRKPAQMTEQDRNLEADAESAIAEHAGYAGLEFNQGKWGFRQIVCPAFPNHLFLRFTRNQGAGDVSVFTASIPRNSEGRVRIIPIERRSYSLFSPAPVNAQTIDAFNHIRAEERADGPTPWVGISLCYAALAGARLPLNPNDDADEAQTVSSILTVGEGSGFVMRLTDLAAAPHPTEWALTFDRKGKLIKSSVKAAGFSAPRKVRETPLVLPASVPQPVPEAASATPPA